MTDVFFSLLYSTYTLLSSLKVKCPPYQLLTQPIQLLRRMHVQCKRRSFAKLAVAEIDVGWFRRVCRYGLVAYSL
jgi:hypothetical protein